MKTRALVMASLTSPALCKVWLGRSLRGWKWATRRKQVLVEPEACWLLQIRFQEPGVSQIRSFRKDIIRFAQRLHAADLENRSACIPRGLQLTFKRTSLLVLIALVACGILAPGLHAQYCAPINAQNRPNSMTLPTVAQARISAALGRDQSPYQTETQDGVIRMTSPRNRLSADFTPTGVDFRVGANHWGMMLNGYGYGDKLKTAASPEPVASANRVEYARGGLSEWYVNGPLGLEQGFTVQERPGKSDGEPLTLAFSLSGDLVAGLDAGERGLTLEKNGVPMLRYDDLVVSDASGRELKAWMEVAGNRLRIRVNDAGARYPLVVDPFYQAVELTACEGASGDNLGSSASLSADGTTLVAGALNATIGQFTTANCTSYSGCPAGAAYVFLEPGSPRGRSWGNSIMPIYAAAKLLASDGAGGDLFGGSVSASSDGSTVVVGASQTASGPTGGPGAAGALYVFVRPANGWSTGPRSPLHETIKLTTPDGALGDGLGWSVSISADGSIIVAGAPQPFANPQIAGGSGAAYVFVRPASGWASYSDVPMKLTADATALTFGASVGINAAGDTIIMGAPASNSFIGSAYVFTGGLSGWMQAAKLTANNGQLNDRLGAHVSISGDGATIAVGSDATVNGVQEQGAAYVFVKPTGPWADATETARLTASDGALQDGLGLAVALSSDGMTLAVAAPFANIGSNIAQGAMYIYPKPPAGWKTSFETLKFTNSNGEFDGLFGNSVSINGSGTIIAAGEPDGTVNSNPFQGAAYVFTGSSAAPVASLSTTSLSFAGPAGITTASQSVTLTNTGTLPLAISSVDLVAQCDLSSCTPTPFSSTKNCLAASPLAPEAQCSEYITFAPTSVGFFNAFLTFSDDGAGAAGTKQLVSISGGAIQAATSTAITHLSAKTALASAPITVSFSVLPPTADTLKPSGTVTVKASTGESCTGAAPSGSCPLIFTTLGSHNINATYSGDANFQSSTSSSVAVGIVKASTATSLSRSPNPALVGQKVTLKFNVIPEAGTTATPSGSVTVKASTGESCSGSAPSGSCSLTFTTPATRSITATYSGDGDFNGSASANVPEQVDDFTLSVSPTTQALSAGNTVTYTVTLHAANGFAGSVALSCSGGPAGTGCAMTPASVTLKGSAVSATAKVSIPKLATKGDFTMTFRGSFGGATRTATASLTVK